jgi:hypothetical protein
MMQLALPAALVPGRTVPCPCALAAPPGTAAALDPGAPEICYLPSAPVQAFARSIGPCDACGGSGQRVHAGQRRSCGVCGGTGSAGKVLVAGAWRRCSRGHEWRPIDARRRGGAGNS